MTSVVKVSAHCSDEKEVVVKVINFETQEVKEEQVLQNGETTEKHIYDSLVVSAIERVKEKQVSQDPSPEPRLDQADDSAEDEDSGEQDQDPENAPADVDQSGEQAGDKQD